MPVLLGPFGTGPRPDVLLLVAISKLLIISMLSLSGPLCLNGVSLLWATDHIPLYREMEKMPVDEPSSLSARLAEKPVLEALQVAFDPLTLRRPLKLFGRALGLRPGIAGHPDPDFLVQILEGGSHQEQLRKAAGAQFKNLEHFLRGAHTPTATTWNLLLLVLGTDDATLRSLAHGRPDGPLLPAYVSLFQALEGIFLRTYRTATVGTVRCPCCGGDVLDDAHKWWEAQAVPLAADASKFVDRLLRALLGAASLLEAISHFTSSPCLDRALLDKLALPERHPIGNWMNLAKLARRLQHDWQLTVGLDADQSAQGLVPDGRLRKWRSGQDLLPLEKAFSMIAATDRETVLKHAMFAARTLSLAIDVVQAAATTSSRPTRSLAQEIISARLRELNLHFRMGIAALARSKPVTAESLS